MFSSTKFSKALAAGTVIAAVASAGAFAANSSVTATANVNIRKSATTSSAVQAVLPKGATATKLGTSGSWVKVQYKNVTGYVYASYVKTSTSSSSSSSSTSTSKVYVTASSLNVRSGAGTSYSTIGSLKKGAKVTTYGSSNGWYKIKYNGKTGYISSKYTSKTASSSSASSSSSSANSSTSSSSSSFNVKVTADSLNVRSGAGTDYSVKGSLKKGAVVKVTGTSGSWYKISYNGGTGYISSKYTTKTSNSASSSGSSSSSSSTSSSSFNVKVTADSLNVRSGAGTDYSVKGSLKKGAVVKVTGTSGSWYKISYNGGTGYISSKYATKTTDKVTTGSGSTSSGSSAGSSSGSSSGSLSSAERSQVISLAKSKLGCDYVYGAEGPNSFDCSGFTQWLYKQVGVSIPRTSSSQYSGCQKVSKSNLQPGDLVFFSNSSSDGAVGHVALYIGDDTIIHAANSNSGVTTSSLSSSYYTQHYISGGRY